MGHCVYEGVMYDVLSMNCDVQLIYAAFGLTDDRDSTPQVLF